MRLPSRYRIIGGQLDAGYCPEPEPANPYKQRLDGPVNIHLAKRATECSMRFLDDQRLWARAGRISLCIGLVSACIGLAEKLFAPTADIVVKCVDYDLPAEVIANLNQQSRTLHLAVADSAKAIGITDAAVVGKLTTTMADRFALYALVTSDPSLYSNMTSCEIENQGSKVAENAVLKFWGLPRLVVVDNKTMPLAGRTVTLGAINPHQKIRATAFSAFGEAGLGDIINPDLLTVKSGTVQVLRGRLLFGDSLFIARLLQEGLWFGVAVVFLGAALGPIALAAAVSFVRRRTEHPKPPQAAPGERPRKRGAGSV